VTRIDEANTVEAHVSKGTQKHIQLTEGVLNPKAKSGLWLSSEAEKPNEFKGVKTHDEQPIKGFVGYYYKPRGGAQWSYRGRRTPMKFTKINGKTMFSTIPL